MKRALPYLIGAVITFGVIALAMAISFFLFPSPERALPFSATDITIEKHINGFLPDYSFHISAKITPEEYKRFVRRIGLSKHPYDSDGWMYSETEKDWYRNADYKDGYLHYSEGET